MEEKGLLGKDGLAGLEHNSVEYLHTLIEALRLSFADTRSVVLPNELTSKLCADATEFTSTATT